jgi:diacylglycerol kinase family enzyme
MWVQPFRSEQLPPVKGAEDYKVAVLLNANARKVTAKVQRALSHVVPEGDLFLSRSELDARRIAQTVVDRRYHTVFLGGGDGTFTGFVNEILNQVELRRRHHSATQTPRFGVLKLGTGNSLAALVHSSSTKGDGILDDVLRARAGEVPGYKSVDLLMVEGRRAPFAGLGMDGKLLNDYIWVKKNLGKGMLSPMMTGAGGYFASVAFKTVPHYVSKGTKMEAEIINGSSAPAYRLGPDGKPVGEPVAPNGVIYKGDLMMVSAATIPYYGFELKMFPHAGKRRGMFHLRFGTLPPMKILANLGGLWAGTWFPEGLQDWHAKDVTVKFKKPMPFQISGDAEGYRDEVRFEVAPEPVEVVDFTGAVN